jgi:hypothetical protein
MAKLIEIRDIGLLIIFLSLFYKMLSDVAYRA